MNEGFGYKPLIGLILYLLLCYAIVLIIRSMYDIYIYIYIIIGKN